MGLIRRLLVVALCLGAQNAFAAWSGPAQVLQVLWGSAATEVGVSVGDTIAYDQYPKRIAVAPTAIVVDDSVNSRLKAFSPSGGLVVDLPPLCAVFAPLAGDRLWCVFWTPGSGHPLRPGAIALASGGVIFEDTAVDLPYGDTIDANGSIAWFDNRYLYDHTGTLIRETTERPLELGRVRQRTSGAANVLMTFEYPDRIYEWTLSRAESDNLPAALQHVRKSATVLVLNSTDYLEVVEQIATEPPAKPRYKITSRGRIAEWPAGNHGPCELDPLAREYVCVRGTSYGSPLLGPDGSVYTYKAVYPGNPGAGYYVLKWTWQE